MKRVSNIYDKNLTLKNIYSAYDTVYKTCKNKKEVFEFNLNKNINLYEIYCRLQKQDLKFRKYKIFLVKQPKYRIIMSQYIADKVVNHYISSNILIKYLDSSLLNCNLATRTNKGGKLAFELFQKYINILRLNNEEIYILKLDIKKFFYNINHEILIKMLEKDINDEKALSIIKTIIDTTNEDYINKEIIRIKNKEINRVNKLNISEKEKELKIKSISKLPLYEKGKGLPIGNMTSQILAVYYLNELDHFIKEKLK